ncbi:ubiquitin carboxyl-terminal hydrolase-domain-containing protein [Crepidotus variabilis]|uniref:PAN2-PAN3 deadenylation complex catalytic subunit PAN2 n=1 Tax=Crepidotus variabilis TaxID=179855 RepID=A0A9P6JU94_9AGAR|nr:ubiquitin carboxyl-terminal hydrolase-domain-containing protein [Crepidotus variabilis]
MSGSYQPIQPIPSALNGFAQPATTLSFDSVSDILWAGLNSGTIVAYIGTQGIRGPSFRVGGDLGVKRLLAGDNYVHGAGNSNEGLGSWTKGGVNKWFLRPSADILTFSNAPPSSTGLAVSLISLEIGFVSLMTGTMIRQVQTSSLLTQLELSHSALISGSSDGYIRIHDPRTGMARSGGAENLAKAHPRSLQGLQVAGNLIFTIGMGERQGRPIPDPLVKTYDIRTMRALPPIPFSAGPSFIHAVPKRSSTLVVASAEGLINVVDAINSSAMNEFYQLDTSSYLTASAISPNAAYLAFADSGGIIHLMSQAESDAPFNGFEGQPAPMADLPAPMPRVDWKDSTPLNTIGMPYFDSQLLSAWPATKQSKVASYTGPQRIPPQILSSMKYNDQVAYATLPKELRGRRNMSVPAPRKGGARFRSDKVIPVPKMYRKVEIEYSKFGVEDFDFGFYNKTDFSGLETHILNSYTNSMVQVLHYISPVRHLAKAHIATDCSREHCLLCELGFTFRMLEDARGTNCQASNFCRTVRVLAQAVNAIEIIDYGREGPEVNYAQKIQAFHRFLLDSLSVEINNPPNPTIFPSDVSSSASIPSPISQLFGIDGHNIIKCSHCKASRENSYLTHTLDMLYPLRSSDNPSPKFSDLLSYSLFRPNIHKATCQHCRRFTTFTSIRSIASEKLPPYLAINVSIHNDDAFSFWRGGTSFLSSQIPVKGQVNGIDDPEEIVYEVRSIVGKIVGKDQKSHLVAIIKVPQAEEAGASSPWYLFNDFVVRNISAEEALVFQAQWKIPAILYLERVDVRDQIQLDTLRNSLDSTILSRDASVSINRDPALIKHQLLNSDEMPTPGTLVSIDAEFVLMQQEETEFRSDGTKKVLRPARMSLARVSVLRGSGPHGGLPFIDDHIHTSEIIVDYLTEFSGIRFGDLDPIHSRYTLTPSKLVYKKLRYLVDCGCIFIGHGLSKDFRIINIFVPPEQVIDTVDLYFIKSRQRRLSLRFLVWYVLGEHIQTDTHDSIEDARSALRLYNAYQQFEEQGVFDQKLEEIYREGRQVVSL